MSNAYATIHGAITEALWCYEDGPPTIGGELEEQIGRITADACDDLTTAPQVIRTVEEQEALDPDTLLMSRKGYIADAVDNIRIPAVVVATADQVRAARKALWEA